MSKKKSMDKLNETLMRLQEEYKRDRLKRLRNNQKLLGHAPKVITFGKNVPKQQVRDLTKQAQKSATSYRTKELIKEYKYVNKAMEGDLNYFYKPSRGSGWTIGQGIDLSGTSRDEAIKLGMPKTAIRLADKYKAWGTTKAAVPAEVKSKRFKTNTPEWELFTDSVVKTKVPLMTQLMDKDPSLSIQGAAVLAQTDHWSGDLMASKASFKGYHPKLVRKNAQGQMYNPLADLINTGEATDESVAQVMSELHSTLPKGYKQNKRTFERLIGYLTLGNIDAKLF